LRCSRFGHLIAKVHREEVAAEAGASALPHSNDIPLPTNSMIAATTPAAITLATKKARSRRAGARGGGRMMMGSSERGRRGTSSDCWLGSGNSPTADPGHSSSPWLRAGSRAHFGAKAIGSSRLSRRSDALLMDRLLSTGGLGYFPPRRFVTKYVVSMSQNFHRDLTHVHRCW